MKNPFNAIVSIVDQPNDHVGVLSGWDITLKDNFNMVDTLTTASCKYLENHVSIYNATSVDHLLVAGANVTSKTSMDELGMGGSNRTALTGPVLNPHDITRITGGSSGGSAALVASGEVRLGMGSDTGDSVRRPAAFCGIVGVKPSYGRISRYGVIPFASSLDHVAYFTRNVEDAALVLEVLSGRDDRDMTSSFNDVEAYSELLAMDLKGKRIGFFKSVHDVMDRDIIDPSLNHVKELLESQGALIVEKTMDIKLLRAVLPTYSIISNAEGLANHANLDGVRFGVQEPGDSLEDIMMNTRGKGFSTQIKKRFIYGAYALDDENQNEIFNRAKRVRRLIVDAYVTLFDDVDLVLAMASGIIAPKVDDREIASTDDSMVIGESHLAIQNFSGYPSMTIPVGLHEDMPLGINITTKPFDEKTMFAFGHKLEKLLEGKQ